MTIQEAFDRCWNWFVVQGKPRSVNRQGTCRLRGPDGNKCAVGVLISDEDYSDRLDNAGPIQLAMGIYKIQVPSLNGLSLDFLADLQTAHDQHGKENGMQPALVGFAARWNLTIPDAINTLDFKDKSDGQAKHNSPQAIAGGVGMAPAGSPLESAGNSAATY